MEKKDSLFSACFAHCDGFGKCSKALVCKNIMKYKTAVTKQEVPEEADLDRLKQKGLLIETLSCEKIGLDSSFCGISGSPTMVKKIENVVRKGKEYKKVRADRRRHHRTFNRAYCRLYV